MDEGWKFYKTGTPIDSCTDADFPTDRKDQQCVGLASQAQVFDEDGCQATCCGDAQCEVYQWCPAGATDCSPAQSCWTGKADHCNAGKGWISRSRTVAPTPPPAPGQDCTEAECRPSFDDSHWRELDLPHDFVVENNNFTSSGDKSHGYLPYGKGWYRLHFTVPTAMKGKSVWIDFDGVQRDSNTYLNGNFLGNHLSGYTTFRYDISDVAEYGAENVLAVKVDATAPDGWWYDGGGIYRHVWLNSADKVHVAPWGVYLPAEVTGEISSDLKADATVTIETTVANDGADDAEVSAVHTITDSHGQEVGHVSASKVTVKAGANQTLSAQISIKDAELWSDDTPRLYKCTTTLSNKDVVENTFGIRKMEWDKDRGFILNGKQVKIKGFANHQDFAGVGVAIPDSLQAYRVWQMKEMGSNGWRTAHNPPTPALLDECDKQGMLVWDENHRNRDSPDMVEDLRSLILRDRNHPSVIMWSLCNEALCESFNADTAKALKPIVKELDPKGQRPVTAAMNGGYGSAFQDVLDVMGVNYHIDQYDKLHQSHPNQPIIGSETSSDYSDRYIYENDKTDRMYVSSYDVNYPGWGNSAEDAWCAIADRDFVAGGFYWTAFDYKGEPTPYGWPNINSHFGIIDETGFPKDNYYYHQTVFFTPEQKPLAHIVPMHWNFQSKKTVDVWAYTNGDSAELFLNDKSLGVQNMTTCRHVEWKVPYEAGTLKVQAYKDGSPFATDVVETHSEPVAIKLTTDWPLSKKLHADNTDTALVTVSVVDAAGRVAKSFSPDSSKKIKFSLAGQGKLIGKGNGDPSNHEHDKPESTKSGSHSIFNGLARLVVQSTHDAGSITVKAEADGLKSAELTIQTTSSTADEALLLVV
jgi:beta-galactosidase